MSRNNRAGRALQYRVSHKPSSSQQRRKGLAADSELVPILIQLRIGTPL